MEEKRRIGIDMRLSRALSDRIQLRSFPVVVMVVIGCLLLPSVVFIAMKPNLEPISILRMQTSSHIRVHITMAAEERVRESHHSAGKGKSILPLSFKEEKESQSSTSQTEDIHMKLSSPKKEDNKPTGDDQVLKLPSSANDPEGVESSTDAELEPPKEEEDKQKQSKADEGQTPILPGLSNKQLMGVPLVYAKKQSQMNATTEVKTILQEPRFCDFSQDRSDTCSLHGDIHVIGHSSTIIIASPPQTDSSSDGTPFTWKIRPYARKWEAQLMDGIREFSVKRSPDIDEAPRCTVNHSAPAIVFSTGGFVGNFFHDFTDLVIPLFATSRQFKGEVHLLVSDFSYGWVSKYRAILSKLSRYDIINLDRDQEVHCFPRVDIGLISNKELGMEPSKTPNRYSINDFREFLRSAFSLKRKSLTPLNGRKPKLLIILRKGSRSFMNRREVVAMGRRAGFKVVAAGPKEARNLTRFAKMVNSCDMMMGVHGAGLTNMLFMPTGSVVSQIVPWGELHYPCFHTFGAPAHEMGLKYLEYEITEKESSLVQKYSRNDPVFKNPLSIHEQGFGAIWSVFLRDQRVRLDVRRFRNVLYEALQVIQ